MSGSLCWGLREKVLYVYFQQHKKRCMLFPLFFFFRTKGWSPGWSGRWSQGCSPRYYTHVYFHFFMCVFIFIRIKKDEGRREGQCQDKTMMSTKANERLKYALSMPLCVFADDFITAEKKKARPGKKCHAS